MRIGYPCKNLTLENAYSSTFRLKSFSETRFNETVKNNLCYLLKILGFNKKNNILFFRISSDIIPFASHPICQTDWSHAFKTELNEIGDFIKKNNMRVSMHPDQFVVLNSTSEKVIENSIRELQYHSKVLESMTLPTDAKIQIHIGGVYGDKNMAKEKFINSFNKLEGYLKERIIIENDDRSYSLKDCLDVHSETGTPIVFDTFHHECLNHNETMQEALFCSASTWKHSLDGNPIIDYSSQSIGERKGKHAKTIDKNHFIALHKELKKFIQKGSTDLDVMLEIKDKEASALLSLALTK
ncbi:MAG: UV DNA damage repair endonuclease UvsE [Nitrosopumilus sp.]|nr:UV DNA damage repair endonuclease UvsE [Nitrosopumilus sp.]